MPTPFFADLVRELCQEGGTGPLTPTGAVPGHRRFADVVPADVQFHYAIAGIAQPGQWEVGRGRIDGSGRLVRDLVASSSNNGAPVDFATGLKTIALTVGAAWFAGQDGAVTALTDAVGGKQPLSTTHAAAATGLADDQITVRRAGSWVNVPLSALAYRDADGRFALTGGLGVPNGTAAAPTLAFSGDADTGLFRPASDTIAVATGGTERIRVAANGRITVGGAAANYRFNIGEANPGRGVLADFGNIDGAPNGALISFTQNGIANWCIGQVPATSAFAIYRDRNGGNDGTELWRWEAGGAGRPGADNAYSLGTAAHRIATVFAGTGTINTSDSRDKAWRGAMAPAELRAAIRIAAELGFYQWHDAIAEKGPDGARQHFGVRAQQVWTIMADEGLVDPLGDDGRPGRTPYAFLCWDEWRTDGGAAYSRFGLRSDQLALFIMAALAQRLAALEVAA